MASQHVEKGNQVYVSGRLVSDVLEGEDEKLVQEHVQKSARNLLSELVKLSDSAIDPSIPKPVIQPPSQDKLSQEVTVKHSRASNIEMKRGDWLCPKNFILGCWSKDVKHILPLMNCGTSDAPSKNESACQSLILETYMFLDRNVSFYTTRMFSFINVDRVTFAGFASVRDIATLCSLSHSGVIQGLKDKGNSITLHLFPF
ncbi:hypothetical protein Cni_G16329 [Canna indica]|uniref:Uncharacterized protein n=1 Tax=Canna indica TaxID=4628 RepID=A0AAQ3KF49_9LILI|nr:hypothetical protein Cni_G16329 [Canna indica]